MGESASKICEATGGAAAAAEMQDWVDVSDPNVTTAAGVVMPRLIYGTAEGTRVGPGATARLVVEAVRAGFTGIDTACQPKHYHEPGVGEGLKQLFSEGVGEDLLSRQVFWNQDLETIPYNVTASISAQVAESVCEFTVAFCLNQTCRAHHATRWLISTNLVSAQQCMSAVSLANLGVDYVDSLVLHSPCNT